MCLFLWNDFATAEPIKAEITSRRNQVTRNKRERRETTRKETRKGKQLKIMKVYLQLAIVSILAAFSAAALNPIREHPHSVEVSEGQWANFSCGIKLPGSIQWRIGDFTRGGGYLYNTAEKLPQVEGVTAEKSFPEDITGKVKTETIGVLATAEMDGVPVECMYLHPSRATRNSYSKFALIRAHPLHTASGDHDDC